MLMPKHECKGIATAMTAKQTTHTKIHHRHFQMVIMNSTALILVLNKSIFVIRNNQVVNFKRGLFRVYIETARGNRVSFTKKVNTIAKIKSNIRAAEKKTNKLISLSNDVLTNII